MMEIAKRLPTFQNIHKAKFYAILLALTNIQQISCNIHIFPHIQNNIYLINNHVGRPLSQHNHPCKLLIVSIVHHINWFPHNSTKLKVQAHMGIIGNDLANTLANDGIAKGTIISTPHTISSTNLACIITSLMAYIKD